MVGAMVLVLIIYIGLSLALQLPSVASAVDSPSTCASCHVMEAASQTHALSAHRSLSCADCHVDHSPVLTAWSKASQGLKHVAMQALGRVPHPMVASSGTRELVQRNCLRCHGSVMGGLLPQASERSCLDCHRTTPHGERRS